MKMKTKKQTTMTAACCPNRRREKLRTTIKACLIFAVLVFIYFAARKKFDVEKQKPTTTTTIFEESSSNNEEQQIGIKKGEMISDVSGKQSPLLSSTTALRIQIVSDLHIEFYGDNDEEELASLIVPQAPILALVGDIGYACSDRLRQFLLFQSTRFEKVLFLAGNHEYYNNNNNNRHNNNLIYSMTEQNECMKSVCNERNNLYYMEKDIMVINNVTILATTLWSDIPNDIKDDAEKSINDYHLTYNHKIGEEPRLLTATETSNMYKENISWLKLQLEEINKKNGDDNSQTTKKKVIILTHHTPLLLGTSHPRFDGSLMTHCFSTDLHLMLEQIGPPVVAWACGHTHYNFDLMVGNVRVVSNQRGYKNDPKFDYRSGGIVLEIDYSDS